MKIKIFLVLAAGLAVLPHSTYAGDQAVFMGGASPLPVLTPTEAAEKQNTEAAIAGPSENTLDFMAPGALSPADPVVPVPVTPDKKTVIHFMTGLDIDQLTSPVSPIEKVRNVELPISVLIYEKCTHAGNEQSGTSECEWRYSSGFKSSVFSTHERTDDKEVVHTTLTETNREGTWQGQREITHTTLFENGKAVSETYDILYKMNIMPGSAAEAEKAQTREVLRYRYAPGEDKKIQSMSWTKYSDSLQGVPRDMEYHAVLVYDEQGQPVEAKAAKWTNGWKAKTLFEWNARKDIPDITFRELWQMWEQWIKNGPSHVFIV